MKRVIGISLNKTIFYMSGPAMVRWLSWGMDIHFQLFLSGGNSFLNTDLSWGGLPYNTFRLLSAVGLSFQRAIAFK
jgi:hypothetical protein